MFQERYKGCQVKKHIYFTVKANFIPDKGHHSLVIIYAFSLLRGEWLGITVYGTRIMQYILCSGAQGEIKLRHTLICINIATP